MNHRATEPGNANGLLAHHDKREDTEKDADWEFVSIALFLTCYSKSESTK